MGFLDNLENSLKSLESQEERDPNVSQRREEDRARTLAVAPWADQLKNSSYTKDLLDKAAIAGHKIRAKVYMAWVEKTLRLEAKGRVLELRPTSDGIVAEFVDALGQTASEPVDLNGSPDELLQKWLKVDLLTEPRP
jgi:hypothetical protein